MGWIAPIAVRSGDLDSISADGNARNDHVKLETYAYQFDSFLTSPDAILLVSASRWRDSPNLRTYRRVSDHHFHLADTISGGASRCQRIRPGFSGKASRKPG